MINSPDGAICVIVEQEDDLMIDQGQVTVFAILRSVRARLEILEESYGGQLLSCNDHNRIIREIEFLLSLLPAQVCVTLDAPLYHHAQVIEPVHPMSMEDCAVLVNDLEEEPFSDNQLSMLRIAASSAFFLVEQVAMILECFAFEDDRVEAVRILYPRILDDDNAYRLFDKFVFSRSKSEVAKILQ